MRIAFAPPNYFDLFLSNSRSSLPIFAVKISSTMKGLGGRACTCGCIVAAAVVFASSITRSAAVMTGYGSEVIDATPCLMHAPPANIAPSCGEESRSRNLVPPALANACPNGSENHVEARRFRVNLWHTSPRHESGFRSRVLLSRGLKNSAFKLPPCDPAREIAT